MPIGRIQYKILHMREDFAEALNEKVRDINPRTLSSVPGLKFIVHHVAGMKYFSLQHEKSGKHLIKSLNIQKVRPTVELANHYFANYDFTKSHEAIKKDAPHLYGAIQSFRKEVDRVHGNLDADKAKDEEKLKEKKKNKAKKK